MGAPGAGGIKHTPPSVNHARHLSPQVGLCPVGLALPRASPHIRGSGRTAAMPVYHEPRWLPTGCSGNS
jgi:hypothetical protein